MTKVDEELNKILSDDKGDDNSGQASGTDDDSNKDQNQDQGQKNNDDETAQKKAAVEQELANLEKAKREAQAELKSIRDAKRKAQGATEEEDEELPKINMEDPSSKAWDKHMEKKVSPMQQQLEKEKTEVRELALEQFLSTKPALAKNEAKLKEVMASYSALATAADITEKNKDIVLKYLEKAYAAVFHDQLMSAARDARIHQAEEDADAVEIAVSSGATNYREEREKIPVQLSRTDREAILKMGYNSVEEWMEDYKKYSMPKPE